MKLVDDTPRPLAEVRYRSARSGGGTEVLRLPVEGLRVDRLPDGCDAVIVASDLQGVAPSPWGGDDLLLGAALAEHLAVWADAGTLPRPERVGVILAGDLYSAPGADVRGASGDVTEVWQAFALAGCPLVTGVLGNHDAVGELEGMATILDGTVVDRGVRIGGVGGIIGDASRPGRRGADDFAAALRAVRARDPDVVVLHEGPPGGDGQPGNPSLVPLLDGVALIVCGHVGWPRPVAPRRGGHVLNVDGRAIVLTT